MTQTTRSEAEIVSEIVSLSLVVTEHMIIGLTGKREPGLPDGQNLAWVRSHTTRRRYEP